MAAPKIIRTSRKYARLKDLQIGDFFMHNHELYMVITTVVYNDPSVVENVVALKFISDGGGVHKVILNHPDFNVVCVDAEIHVLM